MTRPIPPIREHMTASPHSIGFDQPCSSAYAALKKHDIRHLPVLQGGALVGVISDRDLYMLETLKDVDTGKLSVEEAMSTAVYAVSPETPLDEVLTTMADRKYGSAVVMTGAQVVGIFTTVDVCRAFAALLKSS
jgi:acetoin utilization protein AcuB